MQRGIKIVDGPPGGDYLLGSGRIRLSRIRKRGGPGFQRIQALHSLLICKRQQEDVASLFRTADGKQSYAWRGGRQRAAIGVHFFGAGEFAKSARNAPPKGPWRRNRGRGRQIGHEWRGKSGLGGGFGNFFD